MTRSNVSSCCGVFCGKQVQVTCPWKSVA